LLSLLHVLSTKSKATATKQSFTLCYVSDSVTSKTDMTITVQAKKT